MAAILIIDDDKMLCEMLCLKIGNMRHNVKYALTIEQGLENASSDAFDVVFLDVRLPDGNGLEALPKIREMSSAPEIIIITGEGSPDGAELAIESGAWDYVEKPLSANAVALHLTRVLQYREGKASTKSRILLKREGIIGESRQIRSCLDLVGVASNNDSNVLITGETGTGKEIFAKAIHENSARAGENFMVVDCAALTENLVESTLFGHEKGAFTGADKIQTGLIKLAHRGTLFLDEVGELPVSIQKTFLRVLQEHRYRPVGGKQEIESNFRLVAATNRNLEQMLKSGEFRSDLLFRLGTTTIELPPLREREQDIKDLVFYYVKKLCDRYGMELKGLSPDLFESLETYNWPGNVRELINALEYALSVAQSEPILCSFHLPNKIRVRLVRSSMAETSSNKSDFIAITENPTPFPNLRSLLEKTEQQYFQELISFSDGDIKQVCSISGLSRAVVYGRLKKYNIARRFRDAEKNNRSK